MGRTGTEHRERCSSWEDVWHLFSILKSWLYVITSGIAEQGWANKGNSSEPSCAGLSSSSYGLVYIAEQSAFLPALSLLPVHFVHSSTGETQLEQTLCAFTCWMCFCHGGSGYRITFGIRQDFRLRISLVSGSSYLFFYVLSTMC